jgi:hypothetical protein
MRHVSLILTSCLVAAATVAVAMPQEQAKARAKKYATMFGMPFDLGTASILEGVSRRRPRTLMVVSGETTIAIEEVSGRLVLANDGARDAGIWPGNAKPGRPPYSEGVLWARAEKLLRPLGLPSYLKRDVIRPTPDGGKVTLKFYATVNGYRSYGNGNKAVITFAVKDLAVVSVEARQSWTYGPPIKKVTEAQAIATASKVIRPKTRPVVTLGYFSPGVDMGGAEGKRLFDLRQCRLSYSVGSARGTVLVDAITGLVIGGGRL